jgi:endonuclease YncB( thermonuclease family)
VKLRYDSPCIEDVVQDGQIPSSNAHFPLPLIGFLCTLDGETSEVVRYGDGATIEVATNGDRQSIITMRIAQIFTIMGEETTRQRLCKQDATTATTVAAAVATILRFNEA